MAVSVAEVFLGLGSNRQRYRHLHSALEVLVQQFGSLALSRVFESEAVGFAGRPFLNMVVQLQTALPLAELAQQLRQIERDHGRAPLAPKFSPRTLDIDILLYDRLVGEFDGVVLPRDEILHNAFVLWPLSELAPEQTHPLAGQTYGELWRSYDGGQVLAPVPFRWRGRDLSQP